MAQIQFRSDDTTPWNEGFGNGSDGAYAPSTGTDAPIDSTCTGTISTTSLAATNASFAAGQLILIHQSRGTGAGQWQLNRIVSYTAGTITLAYPLAYAFVSGAQVLVIPQYSSGNIAGGVTITTKAWDGSVGGIYTKFATGTFTIAGTLTAKGKGYRGSNTQGTNPEGQGEGTAGDRHTHSHSANGNGGGGGEAEHDNQTWASGGGGGNGTAGGLGPHHNGNQTSTGGDGGATAGNAGLTVAVFGGGSGAGANSNGETGGAFVLIIAKDIVVTGTLPNEGNNGASGATTGGSGGAGGSTLFKGQTIVLGSSLVTAAGGTGGTSGADGSGNSNGAAGGVGRIHADYLTSISGTTSPTLDSRQDNSLYNKAGFLGLL